MTRFRHLKRVRRMRISRVMTVLAAPAIALSMVQPASAAPLPEPGVGSTAESRTDGSLADAGGDSSDEATRIEELTAVVEGDRVMVNGRAAFVDVPATVGQDPVGDGAPVGVVFPVTDTAAVAEALGADLTAVTIARPDPFADTLTFTIRLADPPTVDQEPTPVTFHWRISLLGAPRLDSFSFLHYTLEAARSGHFVHPGSLDPVFRLILGSIPFPTDINPFKSHSSFERYVTGTQTLADLQGAVTADTIQWHLPFGLLEAEAGSTIIPDGALAVTSNVGLLGGPQPRPLDGMTGWSQRTATGELLRGSSEMDTYTIPDPTVQIGIAAADTPVGEIAFTTDASVESSGSFAGFAATPPEPGGYIVVVRACYGSDNCDTATTSITVT